MESQEFLHVLQQISRGKIYIHGQASHCLVTYYQEQLEARPPQDETETGLSDKTVKNQMSNILIILQVQNRTAAIVKAAQQGWITIPKNT